MEFSRCTPGSAESTSSSSRWGAEVFGEDAQQVVRVAEQSLRLHYLWDFGDGAFEAQQCLAVFLAHGDEYQCLEAETDRFGVDDRDSR